MIPKWLKEYDAFPKIDKELTQKTESGGIVSVFIISFLSILLFSEVVHWRTNQYKYEYLVDHTVSANAINVNVDITVAMKCEYARLDVLDAAEDSLNIDSIIPEPVSFHVEGTVDLSSHLQAKQQYNHRPVEGSHTSKRYNGPINACRFFGSFDVSKVEGSFHITAKGHGYYGEHAPHEAINFTHRIDELSFGKRYPGLINPLDKTHINGTTHFDNFMYFLGIVPTIYADDTSFFGNLIVTNQYAVTEFNHAIDENKPDAVPGIFLKYNIEPIAVRVTQFRPGFVQFVTRTCGIAGGIFVTAGVLLRFTNWIQRSFK